MNIVNRVHFKVIVLSLYSTKVSVWGYKIWILIVTSKIVFIEFKRILFNQSYVYTLHNVAWRTARVNL